MNMPMWLFISGWTAYELSTHHFGLSLGSIVSVMCFVPKILYNSCQFLIVIQTVKKYRESVLYYDRQYYDYYDWQYYDW